MDNSPHQGFLPTCLHRLRTERRLLVFVTAMAFLAGVLLYLRYDIWVRGMPLPLFTGLLYATFVGTAAAVTLMVVPALRIMIEAVAISRLGVAVAAYGMPAFGAKLITSPIFSATVVILAAIAVKEIRKGLPVLAAYRAASATPGFAPVPVHAGRN